MGPLRIVLFVITFGFMFIFMKTFEFYLFFVFNLILSLFEPFLFSGLAYFDTDHLQRDSKGKLIFPAIPKEKSKQQQLN